MKERKEGIDRFIQQIVNSKGPLSQSPDLKSFLVDRDEDFDEQKKKTRAKLEGDEVNM